MLFKVKLGSRTVSAFCWRLQNSQTAVVLAGVLLMNLLSTNVLTKFKKSRGMNNVDFGAECDKTLDGKRLQTLLDAVVNHHSGVKISNIKVAIS